MSMNECLRLPPSARPIAGDMFPGFHQVQVTTSGTDINLVCGGEGPPLLLLHGNPLTHVSWHKIAPQLARHFTVVAPDLRGYGDSGKPEGGPDHGAYSFRAMAQDQIEVMEALGFERFRVAGHDRGGRVGHRMALDHSEKVQRLAVLDIVPTHHLLTHISKGWATESYHWFFMAQAAPFPEKLLGADLEYYIRYKLAKKGVGLGPFTEEAMSEYIRCCTPENIHAVCEDYRATLTIDFELDAADRGKRFVECPLLALWGENSHVGRHFAPVEAWREWASDVTGVPLASGHYPAEQCPDETAEALLGFMA
ncbi:alpha/beta hydrolase [Halomonas sp. 1513]|nr:alpha/beta hydrolase [Halomonas sp. 1513]